MHQASAPLICVVDDDDAVRESVAMLLATVDVNTRSFRDCQSFLKDPEAMLADGLILDVRLPGINGLEFQAQFAERIGAMPVIFISGHGDIPMAVRAMQQGALDFLQKPFSEQALIDRVNQAITLSAERRSQRADAAVVQDRLAMLTPREQEVLEHMLKGQSSKVIGNALDISARTVEQHRARVMEKMGAASIAELIHATTLAGEPTMRKVVERASN